MQVQKITINEITNFFSLLFMFLLGEIHSMTFSTNIAYTKMWILSTPIGYQPINHALGFHMLDHVVMHIIKFLVPNIKTLGVVLLAWNSNTKCIMVVTIWWWFYGHKESIYNTFFNAFYCHLAFGQSSKMENIYSFQNPLRCWEKISVELGNMNDILENACLLLAINPCFENYVVLSVQYHFFVPFYRLFFFGYVLVGWKLLFVLAYVLWTTIVRVPIVWTMAKG